ncbi:unnamed protein product [Oppiella nova]|uniref:MICOS complex subunit n=1 Tax=Oppiella nova TaxID=334625 RepID=A0A7R9QWD0_9ACAR|nr:unnamed protein product [Oppiella nova]CAG2178052.1 unnamed protein product [Oppiella nova]
MSSSASVATEEPKTKPCCKSMAHKKLIKCSEVLTQLPLYGNPYPPCDRVITEELGYIESGVRTVRQEMSPYVDAVVNGSQRVGQILNTSSEGNTVAKAAFITGGGLLGLLISARKGFFRKLFYTSAGLTAASAACYPLEAKELSQIGFFIVKTKGPEIIKEYTGVDLTRKKGSKESAPQTESKSIDTIGQESNKTTSDVSNKKSEVKGDFGMGRKEDQDLYANRSSK